MNTKILEYIDFEKVNTLLEGFNQTTGFVTAILDLEGNVLSKSGWRQICTEFHRINPETAKNCAISDTVLANEMSKGEKYHFYKCLNGLVDVAVPIIIKGEHVANLFSGQFFFEKPDVSFFKKQAKINDFEESSYIKALEKVPILSREKVKTAMNFLLNMTEMISEIVFQKLEQIELNKERKNAEEALRLREEMMRNSQSVAHICSYSTDLNVNDINKSSWVCSPEFYKIFGIDETYPHTIDGWANFIHPDYRKKVFDYHESVVKEKKTFSREYKIIRINDGAERWVHGTGKLEFDEKGNPVRMHGAIQDITERKNTEKHLRQAQKMESVGSLAGGIAHDFNNILFPIIGYTEMLLEDIPEGNPIREKLNEIFTGALRARDLVKQILTFSRQDSNEAKLLRIHPVIEEALKLIRSTIPTTINIKQDIRNDCGIIKADPTQIHQIVMNLATNAYHAMEENGGELKVNLKEVILGEQDVIGLNIKPGAYAYLTVADTGIGMDKHILDKAFDPYFTTKEQGKGTGLGLSVIHGIVKNAGGSINVYSEIGKGTQFNVYLPVVKRSSEQHELQTKKLIRGGTEHILLVDDEIAILKMEKQLLERLGYKVTSCDSSLNALETFRATPDEFDVVITDMAMPNMSGEKLGSELIKLRPDIPILLCTGFSEIMPAEKATSMGIKGVLMKPIVQADLSSNIRKVLDDK